VQEIRSPRGLSPIKMMEPNSQPDITSFVLRFVHESDTHEKGEYRGSIRHIQSDEVCAFTQWQDAVNFIIRFIPINTPSEEK
jgi:hypothetical protein